MKRWIVLCGFICFAWVSPAQALFGLGSGSKTPVAEEKRLPQVKPVVEGKTGANCIENLRVKAEENIKNRLELDEEIIKPSDVEVSKSIRANCLDKYRNFSLAAVLGVPDLSSLAQQFINQACRYADRKISEVIKPLNQSIWTPDGVRVRTGVVFGNGAKDKPPVDPRIESTGQYKLPQIFPTK